MSTKSQYRVGLASGAFIGSRISIVRSLRIAA